MFKVKKGNVRLGRVLLAMAIIVGVLTTADAFRRSLANTDPYNIKVIGDFRSSDRSAEPNSEKTIILENDPQATSTEAGVQNLGFLETFIPSEDLYSGNLAIYDEAHPAKSSDNIAAVDLIKYKNDCYSLVDESIKLNEDAAVALNRLMEGYNEATGLSDFVVYGTNETYVGDGSFCPEYFPESISGNTVDFALNSCYGTIIAFDGRDDEGWVIENCWKYGFIVRYPENKSAETSHGFCPWHLRYVGEIHSSLMHEKNLCLEEYVASFKSYTFEEPFEYTVGGTGYIIYGVPAESEGSSARVPVSGNYSISGNSSDGYIITALKN